MAAAVLQLLLWVRMCIWCIPWLWCKHAVLVVMAMVLDVCVHGHLLLHVDVALPLVMPLHATIVCFGSPGTLPTMQGADTSGAICYPPTPLQHMT